MDPICPSQLFVPAIKGSAENLSYGETCFIHFSLWLYACIQAPKGQSNQKSDVLECRISSSTEHFAPTLGVDSYVE